MIPYFDQLPAEDDSADTLYAELLRQYNRYSKPGGAGAEALKPRSVSFTTPGTVQSPAPQIVQSYVPQAQSEPVEPYTWSQGLAHMVGSYGEAQRRRRRYGPFDLSADRSASGLPGAGDFAADSGWAGAFGD